jgi:hypothetical protein
MRQSQFPISLKILEYGDGVAQIGEDFVAYLGPHSAVNQEQGGAA